MHIDLTALPDDVATLHRMIGELTTTLDSERVRAHAEIDRLRQIVKVLQRSHFGRRSERLDDDQLQLGLEDLDADIARTEADLPPEVTGRERELRHVSGDRCSLPDHLPRAELAGALRDDERPAGDRRHARDLADRRDFGERLDDFIAVGARRQIAGRRVVAHHERFDFELIQAPVALPQIAAKRAARLGRFPFGRAAVA
jgi:hypothetical protein